MTIWRAKGWSSRSSTRRSSGTAGWAAIRSRCGRARRGRRARARRGRVDRPVVRRAPRHATARRRRGSRCGWRTSRSPARGLQVVAHWAPTNNTPGAPLHRLLFGDRSDGGAVPDSVPLPDENGTRKRFASLAATSGGLVSVEVTGPVATAPLTAPDGSAVDMSVRDFDRRLDTAWRRTSYTGITAGLHEASGATVAVSEPETPGITDEPPDRPEVEATPAGHGPPGVADGGLAVGGGVRNARAHGAPSAPTSRLPTCPRRWRRRRGGL